MRFTKEMRGYKMIDEIYFLEEERETAEAVIRATSILEKKLKENRDIAIKKSNNVSAYDEKIEMCETRILKQKAKIQYINSILKFIKGEK